MVDVFQGWGLAVLRGAVTTIAVAVYSLILGFVWAMLGAMAQLSANGLLRGLGRAFTVIVRGTPELLIILIVYFGGAVTMTRLVRTLEPGAGFVELPALGAGVFALSLVFGGYAAEVLRGAYLAVPKGEMEAAAAFGMSRRVAFLNIRLPLMWRVGLPGLGNNWISLIKDTSLISIVGLEELMRVSAMATSVTNEPFRFYLAAAAIYFVLIAANTAIVDWLERRSARGDRKLAQ